MSNQPRDLEISNSKSIIQANNEEKFSLASFSASIPNPQKPKNQKPHEQLERMVIWWWIRKVKQILRPDY